MDGEFFRLPPVSHPAPVLEGGHAMTVVGYSDVYRTKHNQVGGFILKNSWWDGLPPGPGWKKARYLTAVTAVTVVTPGNAIKGRKKARL